MADFEQEMAEMYGATKNKKPEKREEKANYIAGFDGLCDLVDVDGECKFLMMDGTLQTEVMLNGKKYKPPAKEKLCFDLPDYARIVEYVTDVSGVSDGPDVSDVYSELFEKVQKYHEESAELPDPRLNILITAWDFHTHLQEKFGHSPIIFYAGLPEKGKSRMASSMLFVARRGVRKASVSDAQIIREASDQGATIFFDMTNFWESIKKSGSEDVVLSRFERGLKVGRVLNPEKGPFEDMTYFNVFGPTIIASNDTVEQVLGSRTVSIVMRQSKRKFKKLVDEKAGKALRDKLVAFRLKCLGVEMPEVDKIVDGRFGDILKPLHQIIKLVCPSKEADFIGVVKELQNRRMESKSGTVEGEIIQTILSLKGEVYRNILPTKMITDTLNKDKTDREKQTYQKIGRRLNIMGFQKATMDTGASAIEWNEELVNTLAIEHGILESNETPQTSPCSETSEMSVTNNKEEELTIGQIQEIFKDIE